MCSSSCKACSEMPYALGPPGVHVLSWGQRSWEDLQCSCTGNRFYRSPRSGKPDMGEPQLQQSVNANSQQHGTLTCTSLGRAKPAAGGKEKRGGGRAAAGQATNRLLKFLLPLVGKRVVVLLLLAVCRTALANRLARVQVRSATGCSRYQQTGPFLSSTWQRHACLTVTAVLHLLRIACAVCHLSTVFR